MKRGHGAMAARLTPDQKVGSSNLSALIFLTTTSCQAPGSIDVDTRIITPHPREQRATPHDSLYENGHTGD